MFDSHSFSLSRGWRAVLAALAATALAAACGGGGVDTGGTGATASSFSSGRISGFGSVIVNGVRFDDSAATITDDDGNGHSRSELKLGMVVDIDAGEIGTDDSTGAQTGQATHITFSSEIKGPVEALDVAAGRLTVLGQTVAVDDDTVFDDLAGGLAGLQAGDLVEVYAFFDTTTGVYNATRIERTTGLTSYKLRGAVAQLDSTAQTFTIGSTVIGYAGVPAAQMPTLRNGLLVRVTLQTTAQAGVWAATKISGGARHVPEQAETEVEGFVTDFAGLASFSVGGVPVDASGATVNFHDGTAADLAEGIKVEVQGKMESGVLVAQKVEFKGTSGHGNGHHGELEIELHGAVESAAPGDASFVLRGVTVHVDANTEIDGGTLANLVVGAQVEVKGNLITGSSDVLATKIQFED